MKQKIKFERKEVGENNKNIYKDIFKSIHSYEEPSSPRSLILDELCVDEYIKTAEKLSCGEEFIKMELIMLMIKYSLTIKQVITELKKIKRELKITQIKREPIN